MADTITALHYRLLDRGDIDAAIRLWRTTDGVGLSGADEPPELERFLEANDGLCWCAVTGERLVGTVLCGTDGRRGYLYHLAVDEAEQRAGVGRELVGRALDAARARGIAKCHAMVFAENEAGRAFWHRLGWSLRDDLVVYSCDLAMNAPDFPEPSADPDPA